MKNERNGNGNPANRWRRWVLPAALIFASGLLLTSGCYMMRPSSGGGETTFRPPRAADPGGVLVPDGYAVEVVAQGLTFPTGIAFDASGVPHVTESGYAYGEKWAAPRLIRLGGDGQRIVCEGGKNGPWNGVCYHQGNFFVAEGGQMEGGKILKISGSGDIDVLVDRLPSKGDHHTNGPVIGPDGKIYFGQGTATNSGVVGPDNWEFGWLKRFPEFHDVPGGSTSLRGLAFDSKNPRSGGRAMTAAFSPFGMTSGTVRASPVASGSIARVNLDGGQIEQIAWGLRNPFGVAFAPDGQLYATDNGYDNRGSRPVWGAPDLLWRVEPGKWHGWPDFSGDLPLTDERFKPPGGKALEFVLDKHPNHPPPPVARLAVHSSSSGLDFSRSAGFGHVGQAFIAQFGDMAPSTYKVLGPVGFKVVRVDVASGDIQNFAANRGGKNGPASLVGGGGLERPVAVRFSPDGLALYVVDFGVMTMKGKKPQPHAGTGVVWRITRKEAGR